MRRALGSAAFVACVFLGFPWVARAAWVTEVLSAAQDDDPIDVHLEVGFERRQTRATIRREWVEPVESRMALDFSRVEHRLHFQARVGLYRHLELHALLPLVLMGDTVLVARGDGADAIAHDDPAHLGIPRFPIADVNGDAGRRYRAGLSDMTFGIAWSPFVDRVGASWPTTTLKMDVTAPTGSLRDPTDVRALAAALGGGVGLGQTAFDVSLAVSRAMQQKAPILEPYAVFGAKIAVPNGAQLARGMDSPVEARFVLGTEIVVVDDPKAFQRYALDVSFATRYVSRGRTFTALSDYLPAFDQTRPLARKSGAVEKPEQLVYGDFGDAQNYRSIVDGAQCGKVAGIPCGELNFVDEHLNVTGSLSANIRFSEFAIVRGGIAISHDTDHFLTAERVGRDVDPPGTGAVCDGADCYGKVNARNSFYDRTNNLCPQGATCDERSPYFDPRYDAPGRRFRLEESLDLTFFIAGVATF